MHYLIIIISRKEIKKITYNNNTYWHSPMVIFDLSLHSKNLPWKEKDDCISRVFPIPSKLSRLYELWLSNSAHFTNTMVYSMEQYLFDPTTLECIICFYNQLKSLLSTLPRYKISCHPKHVPDCTYLILYFRKTSFI